MRVSVLIGIAAAVLAALLAVYVAVLRPWHLRWGTTAVEAAVILPGDDLLQGNLGLVTRAITIDAPPERIWPWLMQMGQDRGGFYNYTPLENMTGEHDWRRHARGAQITPQLVCASSGRNRLVCDAEAVRWAGQDGCRYCRCTASFRHGHARRLAKNLRWWPR